MSKRTRLRRWSAHVLSPDDNCSDEGAKELCAYTLGGLIRLIAEEYPCAFLSGAVVFQGPQCPRRDEIETVNLETMSAAQVMVKDRVLPGAVKAMRKYNALSALRGTLYYRRSRNQMEELSRL